MISRRQAIAGLGAVAAIASIAPEETFAGQRETFGAQKTNQTADSSSPMPLENPVGKYLE
jgi:hypothetical protein